MVLPDISLLSINGSHTLPTPNGLEAKDDKDMQKFKNYAGSLPYSIEPQSRMMEMLDFILLRIAQCVEAGDYDVGLLQWDSMLT
jgi:proteasome activator subunit 4